MLEVNPGEVPDTIVSKRDGPASKSAVLPRESDCADPQLMLDTNTCVHSNSIAYLHSNACACALSHTRIRRHGRPLHRVGFFGHAPPHLLPPGPRRRQPSWPSSSFCATVPLRTTSMNSSRDLSRPTAPPFVAHSNTQTISPAP